MKLPIYRGKRDKELERKLDIEFFVKTTGCDKFIRDILYCEYYGEKPCPKTCSYAKEKLTADDYNIVNSNIQKKGKRFWNGVEFEEDKENN